jgi:subtilisin family serine protease
VEGPDLGSNYGFELELVAPGVNINSTWPGDTYKVDTGTSYAVSHVTGVAALIYASKIDPEYDFFDGDGEWDNVEVRKKLDDTALDLGSLGKDVYYGYGLVNAWYANQRPPGDVNSDHYVNIKDVTIVSAAYGSKPGEPNWDPRADINIDNHVNIKDMVIVQSNFGKSDP